MSGGQVLAEIVWEKYAADLQASYLGGAMMVRDPVDWLLITVETGVNTLS